MIISLWICIAALTSSTEGATTQKDICGILPDSRGCNAALQGWYYDASIKKCQTFAYGYCENLGESQNMFRTKEKCYEACDICKLPVNGQANGNVNRWYYDTAEMKCKAGGDAVNANNFNTEEKCLEKCDICKLPVKGQGQGKGTHWYYDAAVKTCKSFAFNGGAGNANKFDTKGKCEQNCDICKLPAYPGSYYYGTHPYNGTYQWYYDGRAGTCKSFNYEGKLGNLNNFDEREECVKNCDICKLPASTGTGSAALIRWYYDAAEKTCKQFYFEGKGGNTNKFNTKEECTEKCGYEHVGCFKDEQRPAISGRHSTYRHDPISNCFKKAIDEGYKYFAVEMNQLCFTSDDAEFTHNNYGKSNDCKNGKGGDMAMDVYKVIGEYEHVGCFHNRRTEPIFGAYSTYSLDPISNCFIETQDKGYKYFALEFNQQCFTSDNAEFTHKKYGISKGCVKGTGGPSAMDVYMVIGGYEHVGCFKDELQPAISGGYIKYIHDPISNCFKKAKNKGYKYFAVERNQRCFTSDDAEFTYNKYGKSNDCKNGRGSLRNMNVYMVTEGRQESAEETTEPGTQVTEEETTDTEIIYKVVGKRKECNDVRSIYTYSRESRYKCDGWPQLSLNECKGKCNRNEIPSRCIRAGIHHRRCKFVVWHWNTKLCHLADDTCQIISVSKDIEMYKKQDDPSDENVLYTLPETFQIQKNNLLTTLKVLGKTYSLTFQVMPSEYISHADGPGSNVMQFTLGGSNGVYGDRIPAVFFRSTPDLGKLHICSAINEEKNDCFNTAALEKDKWTTVKIAQLKIGTNYYYLIFINNLKVHDKVNENPRLFENVKIFAGNPWNEAQPGSIRNITVEDNPDWTDWDEQTSESENEQRSTNDDTIEPSEPPPEDEDIPSGDEETSKPPPEDVDLPPGDEEPPSEADDEEPPPDTTETSGSPPEDELPPGDEASSEVITNKASTKASIHQQKTFTKHKGKNNEKTLDVHGNKRKI